MSNYKRFIEWTGERYVPWVDLGTPEIHYEHLHRYYFASQFVEGKKVLDLASGEGYGCAIMAEKAAEVIGVELDENAVKHAVYRYNLPNVKFMKGSITEIPIQGEKIFDVITCFEAIEHIENHEKLLAEVKRLLKQDGLFIISSPNRLLYSDKTGYKNPYHVRELYFDEFRGLLVKYFPYVYFLGQKVYPVSSIWPLGAGKGFYTEFCVRKADTGFIPVGVQEKIPLYFIAIASEQKLPEGIKFSTLTDVSEELFGRLRQLVNEREKLLTEKEKEFSIEKEILRAQIAEREQSIARLEENLADLKNRMAIKEQEFLQERKRLETQLAEKEQNILQLEENIINLTNRFSIMEKEFLQQKERLEAQVAEKERTIADLEQSINELKEQLIKKDTEIFLIHSSVGWRLVQKYRRFMDCVFPPGTKRRVIYELGQKSLKTLFIGGPVGRDDRIATIPSSRFWWIIKLLRFSSRVIRGEWETILAGLREHIRHWACWNKRIIDTSMRYFARLLVSAYFSSALVRYSFATVKTISNKLVRPWFPTLHERVFVDFKQYLKQQWLNGNRGFDNVTSMGLYSLPKPSKEKFYPKVSIIVPNYNHAPYLRQRLESIYRQTYQNIEVILLDDGSSDESTQILEEYRQRYPNITRCYFNNKNSGSVFCQWKRGIEMAQGELIWIAESDDYCSENLLEELVKFFANEAVMLAFCRTVFVNGDTSQQIWSLEEYLADLVDPTLWSQPFIKSAHQLVNEAWAVKNIIPNVSSAVFRNPRKLELLEDENWKRMKICGDWVFYLHIIRGGLVAYSPNATNFYRIHNQNTSVNTYKQDIYYREHEKVAEELVKLYRLQEGILEKQQRVLELHWRLHRADYSESYFKKCYDYQRIKHLSKNRKPNLLMVTYALTAGGGETFPIRLANLLKSAGYAVTLLNCHCEPTEPGVRKMLRRDIPLLELDRLDKLNAVVNDMGIEIVHSHHAWVDVTICTLLEENPNCKVVVTTHGMYEMMPRAELARVLPLLYKRVNKFVYIADKNLDAFDFNIISKSRFTKISNALDMVPIKPVPREELGINKDDFVLCLVSRAIPEKGWEEGIEAVKLARRLSGKEIHLLLIGEGPEYKRLRHKVRDHFIHFLGFRANVRDYFATSDLGFLPSRFPGESCPLVIIECLQANRPMLASNIGEIAKMLETESGLAGSVFSLDNWRIPVNQVAELIAEYATNKDLYSEHLRRVPAAAKKFDPKTLLHRYEVVYQEVLGDMMLHTESR